MKDIIKRTLPVLWICICLLACSSGGGGDSETASNNALPDDVAPSNTSQLARFSSDEELATYLKSGLTAMASDAGYYPAPGVDDAFTGGENTSGGQNSPAQFSTTNLQESGVDEADIVKTDGRHLYMISGTSQEYFLPAVDVFAPGPSVESTIRVMEISGGSTPESREIATISLEEFENAVEGLYLVANRAGGMPDLLVTVGGTGQNMWLAWDCLGCWQSESAEVGLFDVSAPENPNLITRISLEGRLIASRRIDNMLYLVTRFTPNLEDVIPYPQTDEDKERNQRVIDEAPLAELLPKASFDGGEKTPLVRTDQCYIPPFKEDREPEPSLITVTAVDLDFPESPVSRSIAGPAETVYVGQESLYVATVRYPYPILYAEEDDAAQDAATTTTQVHKFALTSNGPVYLASGSVLGNLGWEEDKKSFRMSEYEGTLRIATSLEDGWVGSSTTRLTLLREGNDALLEETGSIENIGKPGERLYAVQFIGPRGYLVTFRVTDPLYVFDLSDPNRPTAGGELHIDGYSDYLHPIGEDRLLGIGKDAVPAPSAGDFGGRGAWYQGVKLALFDISDPDNPREADSLVIGKRGTESDALFDHHALAYIPPADGAPAKLALPIRLHDMPSDDRWFDPDSPNAYYQWTHTGLYLFEIDSDSIQRTGGMIVADRSNTDNPPWSTYWNQFGDRAVIVDGGVHYIHESEVWSAGWNDSENLSGPK